MLALAHEGLSHRTINHCLKALRIMLAEATKARLIAGNPAALVEELVGNPAQRGTLTLPEVRKLFNERQVKPVWRGDRKMRTMDLLMASTGARMGEAMALMVDNVHPKYVVLSHSWDRRAGMRPGTKSGEGRAVPIPSRVSAALSALIKSLRWREADDLVFVQNAHRGQPVGHAEIARALYSALAISEKQRAERNVTAPASRKI
jgi:site-specific recombinase XerD